MLRREVKQGRGWGAVLRGGEGGLAERGTCEPRSEGQELPGTFEDRQGGPLGGAKGRGLGGGSHTGAALKAEEGLWP